MAYKAGVVGFKEMFYAWFLGVIGGILPDIDSDNSAAVRLIFSLLGIFSIACVLLFWSEQLSLIVLWGMCLAAFISVRFILMEIFLHFTVHRGIFHSQIAAVTLCVTASTLFHLWYDALLSWFLAGMLLIGYLTHLLLDELYSVDLTGARIKKSFGTALKPLDLGNPISSGSFLIVFVFFFWAAPPFKPVTKEFRQLAHTSFWLTEFDVKRMYRQMLR